MRVIFSHRGSFSNLERSLKRHHDIRAAIEPYAQQGVRALAAATPINSGLASESWIYKIEVSGSRVTITWMNTDTEDGFPVAIMLQYGHGTRGGGYVQGRDYINPAIKPIFDQISDAVWRVVTSA